MVSERDSRAIESPNNHSAVCRLALLLESPDFSHGEVQLYGLIFALEEGFSFIELFLIMIVLEPSKGSQVGIYVR